MALSEDELPLLAPPLDDYKPSGTPDPLLSKATDWVNLPDGATRTVSYAYFDNGTRRSVTDPDGLTTAYTYDGKNRLATATTDSGTPQAQTTTYAYWPDVTHASKYTPGVANA